MSINSTGNRDQVQSPAYGVNGIDDQQNNGYGALPPTTPRPSNVGGQQAVHTLRIVLLLLAIICLGSLGAVPLATNFLPTAFVSPSPVASSKPQPTPTPVPTMPGGECTATPQKMQYLSTNPTPTPSPTTKAGRAIKPTPSLPTPTPTPALPSDWLTAGHTQQDFANVQACAASFVATYETVDANDFRTLEASADMLSSGAKLRFYGRLSASKADNRMDPLWRAVIQKQNLKQVAQVALPSLLDARYSDRHLFVWMLVPYHVSLQRNDQMLSLDAQRTVLLVDVASQAGGSGTGWQVSDWRDGDTPFPVPNPV